MAKDGRAIRSSVCEDDFFNEIIKSEDCPVLILLSKEEKDEVGYYVLVKLPGDGETIKKGAFPFQVNGAKHEKIMDSSSRYYGYWACPKTWFRVLMGKIIAEFKSVHLVSPYASGKDCCDSCARAGKDKLESDEYLEMSEEEKKEERDKLQFSPNCKCPCMGEFHGERAGLESPYIFSNRQHQDKIDSPLGYVLIHKANLMPSS